MTTAAGQHEPLPTNSTDWYRAHKAVRRDFGRATERMCEFNCGKQAREWAWMHGQDPWDTTNYMASCKPCHHAYDFSAEWRRNTVLGTLGQSGRKLADELITSIQEVYATGRFTQRELQQFFGVSPYTIQKYTRGMAATCRTPHDMYKRPQNTKAG